MLPCGGSMAAGLQSAWSNFFAHSYRSWGLGIAVPNSDLSSPETLLDFAHGMRAGALAMR